MDRILINASVFALLAVCSVAAPVEGLTVNNPCQIDPQGQPQFPPLHEWLLATLTDISQAQATFQAASQAVVKAGLTADELELIKQIRIPKLPVRDDVPVNVSSMVDVFQSDFTNIAVHILYLQAFIADQLSHDYGRLVSELRSAERCFVVLHCKCDMFMMSRNVTSKPVVDPSVVPTNLTNLSDAKARLGRNYLMMTQSSEYVKSMESYVRGLVESKSPML